MNRCEYVYIICYFKIKILHNLAVKKRNEVNGCICIVLCNNNTV